MSDHQDDSPRPGFLRSLLIVLLWFTRIFRPVAIVMSGNDQRDAEDRATEQWKPQQKELVESGQVVITARNVRVRVKSTQPGNIRLRHSNCGARTAKVPRSAHKAVTQIGNRSKG